MSDGDNSPREERPCRICLLDDGTQQQLCRCYPVHPACLLLQHEIDGRTSCEICHYQFARTEVTTWSYHRWCSVDSWTTGYHHLRELLPSCTTISEWVDTIGRIILVMGAGLLTLYVALSLMALLIFPILWMNNHSSDISWLAVALFCGPCILSMGIIGPYYLIHRCLHAGAEHCHYYFPCCCPWVVTRHVSYHPVDP